MKEIKFRAWDTVHSEMSNAFTLIDCIDDTQAFMLPENFKFMQYTGLSDKNGVGIYEGDVIKTISRAEARQVVWNVQRGCYYLHPLGEAKQDEVDVDEFNTASSMAPHWFTQGCYDTHEEDCAVEIIGNIYETPDLLKVN